MLCRAAGRASRANAKAYLKGGPVQVCTRRQAGAHPATRIRAGQVGEEQRIGSERGQEAERSAFQRAPLSCAMHSFRRCSFVFLRNPLHRPFAAPLRQPKHDARALRSRRVHQAARLHARAIACMRSRQVSARSPGGTARFLEALCRSLDAAQGSVDTAGSLWRSCRYPCGKWAIGWLSS